MKHFVRHDGWLPLCKERLKRLRGRLPKRQWRRLRYFTFCAVGAVDVLMLDVARVVTRSATGRFDTVVFFDRTDEAVAQTQDIIPGSIGFPGDFLATVLRHDDDEDEVVDNVDPLSVEIEAPETVETRGLQRVVAIRRAFIKCFPFDVMNFDLEEFFFRPADPIPGRMVKALERVFEWQKRAGADGAGKQVTIDEFSLMFTTRVGPPNLGEEYLQELEQTLGSNIAQDADVRAAFIERVGHEDVSRLRNDDFDEFLKLGLPKILAAVLHKTGWSIDSDHGIRAYRFVRQGEGPQYEMLHFAMQVRRHPASMPGREVREVQAAYKATVAKVFRDGVIDVNNDVVEAHKIVLEDSLKKIFSRRRKYSNGDSG